MRKVSLGLLIAALALGAGCGSKKKDNADKKAGSGSASASGSDNAGNAGGSAGSAANSGGGTTTAGNSGTGGGDQPAGPTQQGCLNKLDGNIPQGDLSLTEKCGPVTVDGEVYVNAKLTIEPGVTLSFNENAALYIGYNSAASLVAQGTADKPITFTSSGDKTAGWWKGVVLFDQAKRSTVDHAVFEYAGSDGDEQGVALKVTQGAKDITVTNSEFRNGKGWGVWGEGEHTFTKIEGNKFHDLTKAAIRISAESLTEVGKNDTGDKAIEIAAGTVGRSATLWAGSTWRVMGELYVQRPASDAGMSTLTIEPGVTVEMSSGSAIYVGYGDAGSLKAVGTADKPITFTGFDKNKDAWKYIELYNNSKDNAIQHVKIEYAESDDTNGALRVDDQSTGAIEDVTVSHVDGVGVSQNAKTIKTTIKDVKGDDVKAPQYAPAE